MDSRGESITGGDWGHVRGSSGWPQRPGKVGEFQETAKGPLYHIKWRGDPTSYCEYCASKSNEELYLIRRPDP